MRVKDLLSPESIDLNAVPAPKKEIISHAVDLMMKRGNIEDHDVYLQGVYEREEEGTTGIGEGIAIPHCKSDTVKEPGLAAMVIKEGTDYDALDGEPVDLLFLIAAPNSEDNVHLQVLSRLSKLLMDSKFVDDLKNASSPEEFLSIVTAKEDAKIAEEEEKARKKAEAKAAAEAAAAVGVSGISEETFDILAVTACPTGIAHTYMAAEAIENKAKELGISAKVETRGSGGAKNVLTDEEIAAAKGIIVAADTKVPMERFAGKPVLQVKVADGISKPEELLNKAIAGDAPIFVADTSAAADGPAEETGSIGHQAYKHLMSGVSHMLPFVIGGGIMVALSFLIDTLLGYGATAGGAFGTMVPLSAFFKYCGGLAMGLMVPVLAGYIAYSIADRPGLAVGFTGGLLASSGNALVSSFNWENLSGFQRFLERFAFQAEGGGNTVSGFLGGIVVGFLAGFVVLWLKKITAKLPASLEGIKPTLIYPLCGIFIVSVLMCFIFNPLIGLINTGLANMLGSLADSGMLWLLGLILGGMMAIDMGGPINKAAYVFGTGMLATASDLMAGGAQMTDPKVQACYIAMAAVMCGGMVPPLGIALACKFFPKKFTENERSSWISNIVMACSFITEGAIPFAASDPGHVIPCTLIGSAVAGLLSALFGCTLMAPHGGIFVFATVGKPLLYIIAWLAGSLVTMFLLGVIKKDRE